MPTSFDSKPRMLMWSIVLGGLVMSLAMGIRHVQGLFMLPMTLERGWTRESFSFAMAVQNLVWGLAQPFVGMVADKHGSKRVVAVGTMLYGLGLTLMSQATTPLQLTLSAGLLIGLALACTAFGVVYGAVSRIAPAESRSQALGLTGAIGGMGLFFLVPATQGLQSLVGWTAALLIMAIVIALSMPTAMALDDRKWEKPKSGPQQWQQQPLSAALKEAARHRGFWLLNAGFLTCGFQLAFIASHLPAYLLDKGMTAKHAVTGLALIGLTNVIGTYVCGRLGGLYRRKHLLAAIYLARTAFAAIFLSMPLSPGSVYLFCAAMGFLWLGTVPLTSGVLAGMFGMQYISTLFGFVFLGHQLGGFLGAWMGGYIFDLTRSYDQVWWAAMLLGVLAAGLHLMINDTPSRRAGLVSSA